MGQTGPGANYYKRENILTGGCLDSSESEAGVGDEREAAVQNCSGEEVAIRYGEEEDQ